MAGNDGLPNEEDILKKDEGAEDELEVEVVDDTPPKDKGRAPLEKPVAEPDDAELENYSEKVKTRIKELTHARHDERRRAETLQRQQDELQRVAQQLLQENRQLKQFVNTGDQYFAKTALAASDSALELAKKKYKEALESGDAEAIVSAQEAVTEAKMQSQAAKNYRPVALQTEQPVVQQPQPTPQRPQIDDKTLRWQARNQWFGAPGHEEMTSFSLGLHQKLVNSGVDPRSDEYFEAIDTRMKATFPDWFGEKESSGGSKPSTPTVAPATRSSGTRKVQLTASQIALAKKFNLTPQQYAAELMRLEKPNG